MKFAYKVVDIDEEGKFVSSSETGNRQKRYYRNPLFINVDFLYIEIN